jgi:PIN domain nuclease of toxin-antitoxin system
MGCGFVARYGTGTLSTPAMPVALPNPHRDPFDCMLAAQAEIGDIPLATADLAFHHFKVLILW